MNKEASIFVISFTGDSGITHYSISLCRELQKRASVTLVTSKKYGVQGYPTASFDVLEFFNRSRWYPLDMFRFLLLLMQRRPNFVLFQSTIKFAFLEAALVKLIRLMGIKAAMTVHDLLPHYPKPWSRFTHTTLYRSFNRLIVHSDRAHIQIRRFGIDSPVLTVPHGVYDAFNFKPSRRKFLRHQAGIAEENCVLLFFGTIDRRKGIAAFLSLPEILSAEEGYTFLVAGRPALSGEPLLKSQLEAAKHSSRFLVVDRNISFEAVQDYFNMADIVVLPYQEGTTSGVLKLALAFSKPVIATDVGDLGEALKDGIGKLLPSDCSVIALAEGIRSIREDYSSYQNRCNEVKGTYSWSKIGQSYWDFCREGLDGK